MGACQLGGCDLAPPVVGRFDPRRVPMPSPGILGRRMGEVVRTTQDLR